MGNTNVSITVPSADGSGASADLSALGPDKTFVYAGTLVGSVTIEVSNDGSNWAPLITLSSPQEITLSAVANYARAKVSGYKSGTGALSVGGESTSANLFSAVNVPASNGNGTALDVSTYGPLKTFTWGGGTAAFDGSLTVTVSQDGTNYMPLFTLSGITGVFTTSTPCDNIRVTRSGGTAGTAPSLAVGAFNADASGGAGFVPMGGPNLAGVTPAVRSGRGVYVNPADPNAADDSNWQTPKLTITGAIAAIVAAGPPTDVSTSLMRWVMFVAPGCYDENVVIPPEITRLVMVAMGGVTLGDGVASAYGTSTTPRSLTIQASDDYKFFQDAFNNPLPPSGFVMTTMSENFTGFDPVSYIGFGNAATTDYSMFGWRISGNFVLTQAGGDYEDYEDVFPLTLNSVVVEGDFDASNFGAPANPYYYLENCFFYGGWNGGNGATLQFARECLFGATSTGTFYCGSPPRLLDKCTFLMDTVDFGSGGATTYITETTFNIVTLFAWPNTLSPDRYSLKSIHALGRTICAYATSQAIVPIEEPSVLVFGNTDIGAAAGTVYLTPGFQAAAAGAADDKQIPLYGPNGIVITNFIVRHNLTPGANDVTYELLSNGAPLTQAISTTLSAGSNGPAVSSGKAAFVNSATRLSVRAVKPGGGIVSGALNVTVLVYFYPV